jgi:hypothetical protein
LHSVESDKITNAEESKRRRGTGSDAPPLFNLETGWKAGRFRSVYHFPYAPPEQADSTEYLQK